MSISYSANNSGAPPFVRLKKVAKKCWSRFRTLQVTYTHVCGSGHDQALV